MFTRLSDFFKRRPRTFDALIALIWTALTLADYELWDVERFRYLFIAAFAIAGVALFWRRRFPRHVFALQGAIVISLTILDIDEPIPAALICGTYSLAAHTAERRMSIVYLLSFVIAGFATVLFTSPTYLADVLVTALVLGIAWVVGDNLRTRRAYRQSLVDRAERAEALRDSLAHQAVAEERTRIARDLHDVVAHSMSLMVVQAGAARRVATTDPHASIAALEAIESVGRNSLDEMRRILGVLRGEEDGAAMAPQPDIGAIETLAEEFRAAGLPVGVQYVGTPRALSPSIELTAYRIVQESLTNTLKHAGPASATVLLAFDASELRIEVEDDGRPNPPLRRQTEPGSQKGHIGMRERVAAFDGTFTAGPRLPNGYAVRASLPLAEATPLAEGTA